MRILDQEAACMAVAGDTVAVSRDAQKHDTGAGADRPGIHATRPGPLARLAARHRAVSLDLARLAAAARLLGRHDE